MSAAARPASGSSTATAAASRESSSQGARTAKAQKRGAWGACRARLDPSGAFETHPKLAPAPQAAAGGDCHPSYAGACLDPSVSDYDCAGGGGNGPAFTGRVRVVGHDEYDLDPNGDGVGCETSR